METEKKRSEWSSKLGFILAYAGSAVGLGNIWKFPGKAYDGGGAAFIIIYLCIVVLIGCPLMISELTLGRAGKADALTVFKKLDRRFRWVGWFAIITPFIITCYYSQVGGYVIRYIIAYAKEPQAVYARPLNYFYEILGYTAETGESNFPWGAILCAFLFLSINAAVVMGGVKDGIERLNKVAMPMLLIILLVLLCVCLTLPGSGEGILFMVRPDFSNVTFSTFLNALGQAFYSLSLGMGITITYGSYLNEKENIPKNAMIVCGMDTMVALLAGFMIVPACFATMGAENIGKGASFAFASLAGVFEAIPGGRFVAILFYLLIFFAALTSCISLTETLVAYAEERLHIKRKAAVIILSLIFFAVGILYTCSQAAYDIKGIWADFATGLTFPCFGDSMEWICDRILTPVCALGVCVFVGWFWKPASAIREIEKDGSRFGLGKIFSFLVRFIAPAAILLILIVSLATGVSLG